MSYVKSQLSNKKPFVILHFLIIVLLLVSGCYAKAETPATESAAVTSQAAEDASWSEYLAASETADAVTAAAPLELSLPPREIVPGPAFALSAGSAKPGEPVTIAIRGIDAYGRNGTADNDAAVNGAAGEKHEAGSGLPTSWVLRNLQAVLLDRQGRRLTKAAFFTLPREEGEQELRAAILAVPTTAVSGNAVIRIESQDSIIKDLPFMIGSREFISEVIHLDQANTELRTVEDQQKTAESELLWAILSRTGTEIYTQSSFLAPVSSTRRTSFYGDRRVYRYSDGSSDTTIHAGIDYGVPTGTEVRSCAAGRVVLARSRIVTGNSVVLEHLPGLYSLYYHMENITIQEGSVVEAGALLGLSGSTGLATGPHLHWEIRVSGEYADPDAFLPRPILDKKDILSKLRED